MRRESRAETSHDCRDFAARLDAGNLRDPFHPNFRRVVCFLHEFVVASGPLPRSALPCNDIPRDQRSILSAHRGARRGYHARNRLCRWHRRGAKRRNGLIALRLPSRSSRINAAFSRGHGDSRLSVPDPSRRKPHSASPGLPRREVSTASDLGFESCAARGRSDRDSHSSAGPRALLAFAKSTVTN